MNQTRTRLIVSLAVFLCLSLGVTSISFADASSAAEEEEATTLGMRFDDIMDDDFEDDGAAYADPFESTNRAIFGFNRQVDRWILDPVTKAYRYVVPKPVRLALSRVFVNLGSTKTLANDIFQLEWTDAGVTGVRLIVNSTVGIAGLFDVGAEIGLPGHESSFGQSLALAGVRSGPYIVLPLLGPGNVRDGLGTVIDGFFQPTYYVIGPADLILGPTEIILYSGSSGISARDRHFREFTALKDSSVDFYATLRSGYYQQRVHEIWNDRDGHRTSEEPKRD